MRPARRARLLVGPLALLLLGAIATQGDEARFVESSARLGVDFTHRHFGTGEKFMPENMGPGLAVLDADGDERLDLYFVQGRPWSGAAGSASTEGSNRLYLQRANGQFEDATEGSGAGDLSGYGMGVAYGDVDRDGDLDLYLTNYGVNRLLRNRGKGRFEAAAPGSPIDVPAWSSAAGFFDADADGDLDLWVTNYLAFETSANKRCGNAQRRIRAYCHPDVYDGAADVFLRNRGDGTFEEASAAAGLRATVDDKGLGLALLDFDGDGRQDVFVANDSTMNYLYFGREGGFEERGLLSGVAVNGKGAMEASMGVAVADLDHDSRPDLFVTHLDQETNTLYLAMEGRRFRDATSASGLALPSLPWVGFGTTFLDVDLDGDLDLFVANGHIIDNIEKFDAARSHRQPAQLFENDGKGRFVERSEWLGVDERWVGRGAVAADLDRDGDEDLVISQNDGPARILINQTDAPQRSLGVRLRGVASNSAGYGARVELVTDLGRTSRWMTSTTSYLSQGPPEVYFGLGSAKVREVVVHWPSSRVDRYPGLEPGALYHLREGGEVLGRLTYVGVTRSATPDGT